MAGERAKGRDGPSIDELLEELTELRELDQRCHTHAPGSPDHIELTNQLDLRTRRLIDRFRDLRSGVTMLHGAREAPRPTIGLTRTG